MDPRATVSALLHELELPDQVLSLLVAHAEAVAREADRLGLVSERTLEEILPRHTADSLLLALARRPGPGERWVDAGSGAGFPGIVLACAYPATSFLLLEPQQRRMGFLELQALNLGLTNVEISRRKIQGVDPDSADVVVARALERPEDTFPQLTRPLHSEGVALILAAASTLRPEGSIEIDVRRASVDSPGVVFMMHATR